MNARLLFLVAIASASLPCVSSNAQVASGVGVSGPLTLNVSSNGVKDVSWPLIPALDYQQLSTGPLITGLVPVPSNSLARGPGGFSWSVSNALPSQFYSLRLQQIPPLTLYSANVLNRAAYGPTPDDLERIAVIGPDAYLTEQLAMESPAFASDPIDLVSSLATNSAPTVPASPWVSVTVTGLVTTPTLYMYLTGVGTMSLDEVQMRYSYTVTSVTNNTNSGVITTNVTSVLTTNLIVNGGFESALTNGWTVSTNLSNSFVDASTAAGGASSLRMVATSPGTTQGSSIWQALPAAPANRRGTNASGEIFTITNTAIRSIFTFAYIPSADADLLTIRLSGNGLIIGAKEPAPPTQWVYATTTGRATATATLYLYLSGAGEVNIDDLKLVAGATAGVGPNLVANGDFESGLTPWVTTADFTNSYVSDTLAFSGTHSLRLVATAAGGGNGDALYQASIAGLINGQTYTVSYWYTPILTRTLTVRLSGSQLVSSPDTQASSIRRRLENSNTDTALADLRAWFCSRAVGARGQLSEVLLQFLENHFVTQHSKTTDYLDRYYDGGILDRLATAMEYRENRRWREALTNPNCTFYDLLKISAESPAMIIYLDTVGSRGDAANIANENYGRELFELFCMGVDNGYDQNDIVAVSRAWTGWTIDIKRAEDVDKPFALRSSQYGFYPGAGFNQVSNIVGVWTHSFNPAVYGTNRAPIFSVWDPASPPGNPRPLNGQPKRYPARFGAPWAGNSYQLSMPRRTGTNGMADGYDVIRHLADLAFTAEFISVKLCRLFVHDEFVHGVYDYTDPNRSEEAELVRQCIVAWDTPGSDGRKGNIRSVLRTIFASELFQSHGGSMQKVKTPLEFVASSVRALRSVNADGTATASTDGYAFASALSRMGVMNLFNRAEPDGYPESGPPWISAGTLAERLRYVQSYLTASTTANRPGDAGANVCDPVALLKKKLPSASWKNAPAVADYFLSVMFPGEGRVNLEPYRALAIGFLNVADDGVTASAFTDLSDTSATYDTRVRGMVSLLMTTQRFQEQ
jgi:uncharacterized protein (DUF1800 family)